MNKKGKMDIDLLKTIDKNTTPFELILKLKDPDEIFDLVCAGNYFAGNFNSRMPVDESRKAFKRIKKLLKTEVSKCPTS